MRAIAILSSCLLLGACQQYTAKADEAFTVPAEGVSEVYCKTHNGNVEVRGSADADEIRVFATKYAHADSQEEAERNLAALEVQRSVENGTLKLALHYPSGKESGWGSSASYRVEVPLGTDLRLRTHNGRVVADHVEGKLRAHTHNGSIRVMGAVPNIDAETHNGGIKLELDGEGAVNGSVHTHNGGINVAFGPGCSTTIEASTHNGGLRADGVPADVRRRRMTATVGDGEGSLRVSTHNGGIKVEQYRVETR